MSKTVAMTENEQLIRTFSKSADHIEHQRNCGLCHHQKCMAKAAFEIIESGDFSNAIERWTELTKKLWEKSKYFKLYQKELAAGRNPADAFQEKGWEM